MADEVNRRADSCKPDSAYMLYRMRRSWKEWAHIGASVQSYKWIRERVFIPFRHNRPPPPFNQGLSLVDATPEQLVFVDAELTRFDAELTRFVAAGAWGHSSINMFVSRLFLVPKPGKNQ
jgi:hypothetical protein